MCTHRGPDAVGSTAQHHHPTLTAAVILLILFSNAWNRCLHSVIIATHGDIVLGSIVGHVEVVRLCRVLCGQRVDLFGVRENVELLPAPAHYHLGGGSVPGDLAVTEASNLQAKKRDKNEGKQSAIDLYAEKST